MQNRFYWAHLGCRLYLLRLISGAESHVLDFARKLDIIACCCTQVHGLAPGIDENPEWLQAFVG